MYACQASSPSIPSGAGAESVLPAVPPAPPLNGSAVRFAQGHWEARLCVILDKRGQEGTSWTPGQGTCH